MKTINEIKKSIFKNYPQRYTIAERIMINLITKMNKQENLNVSRKEKRTKKKPQQKIKNKK